MPTLFRSLLPTLFGFALAPLVWAASPDLPRVFGASDVHDQIFSRADSHTTVRARAMRPNLEAIADIAARVIDAGERPHFVLELFPGLEVEAETITAERRVSGTTVIATLADVEMGTAVLTVEEGVLTATIDYPGGSFLVTPQPDGTYRLAEIDQSKFPPEAAPRVPQIRAPVFPSLPETSAFDVPTDSGRLIDVMVVWTPAAETAAGGAAAMATLAQSAVDNANAAYLNSGIAQRLRLVWKQGVAYTETTSCGSTIYSCALDDITNNVIPVSGLRTTHGADLVSLLIDRGGTAICGLAWLPFSPADLTGDPAYGFSVVGQDCAVGNLSFPHELGHNMGAHHDPYVLSAGPCGDGKEAGAFCYSRGISHIGASAGTSWRTIMAYNNECAAHFGGGCSRLPYFSNPNVQYTDSNPMGDATYRNNAVTLNKTAKAVAGYRATAVPITPLYTDVPLADPFFGYIQFLGQAAYTGGCAAGLYCPSNPVTRRQMAVFVERVKKAANYAPPTATGIFTDVPPASQFAAFIEALYSDGITSGCTATAYCPDIAVSRAAMAKFILEGKCGSAYVPATPGSSPFTDVALSDPFLPWINKLYTLGITSGCTATQFCPTSAVTRAAMAKFLERGFPFGYPSDTCTP